MDGELSISRFRTIYTDVSKYETQEKMEQFVVDNVRSALETGKLKSPVPEQKDMPLKD